LVAIGLEDANEVVGEEAAKAVLRKPLGIVKIDSVVNPGEEAGGDEGDEHDEAENDGHGGVAVGLDEEASKQRGDQVGQGEADTARGDLTTTVSAVGGSADHIDDSRIVEEAVEIHGKPPDDDEAGGVGLVIEVGRKGGDGDTENGKFERTADTKKANQAGGVGDE
jgi:hypothetical protein